MCPLGDKVEKVRFLHSLSFVFCESGTSLRGLSPIFRVLQKSQDLVYADLSLSRKRNPKTVVKPEPYQPTFYAEIRPTKAPPAAAHPDAGPTEARGAPEDPTEIRKSAEGPTETRGAPEDPTYAGIV